MKNKRGKAFLVRSAPGTAEALCVLSLVSPLLGMGIPVTIVLLQDAVLCALEANSQPAAQRLHAAVADGAVCHYVAPDLAMRGYGETDVVPECGPLSYEGLVDLLLADGVSVAGAF